MPTLESFGWDARFAEAFDRDLETKGGNKRLEAARVSWNVREHYRLQGVDGELAAKPSGRSRYAESLAVVGDWVVVERGVGETSRIVHCLPRRTKLSRKVAGDRTVEQVVAANIDVVMIVAGLDGDFNLRRLERMIAMAWDSGATPLVVLNKSDLADDADAAVASTRAIAAGVEVVPLSAKTTAGIEVLRALLDPERTAIMIGSSGVGKSTLLNSLCGGEVMRTSDVREHDDRGRHTTTHRELIRLPGGSLLIDNPGIRELQLWSDDEPSLEESFADILELAASCRFRDCGHEAEPGCAVRAAVDAGTLASDRLANMRAMQSELRYLELRQDDATRRRIERKQGQFYKSVQSAKSKRKR